MYTSPSTHAGGSASAKETMDLEDTSSTVHMLGQIDQPYTRGPISIMSIVLTYYYAVPAQLGIRPTPEAEGVFADID